MCGRMSRFFNELSVKKQREFMITKVEAEFGPSYNVAPSQQIPVIINGSRILTTMKWGLIPSWAKDKKIGNKLINARAETITEKPSFSSSFKKRRCLILTTGFYEWDEDKSPHLVQIDNQPIMALAGLWSVWEDENKKPIRSCTIITSGPNNFMKSIHHRMPVILDKKDYTKWLESDNEKELLALLKPKDIKGMKQVRVSKLINSVKNNGPELIKPIEARQRKL